MVSVLGGIALVMMLVGITCIATGPNKSTKPAVKTAKERMAADRANYERASKASKRGEYSVALDAAYNISSSYKDYPAVIKIIKMNKARKREVEKRALRLVRKLYAKKFEDIMLDNGFDVTATVSGRDYTTLRVKSIFSSRIFAHKIYKSGILDQMDKLGFKRMEISGGLDETVWSTEW